MSLSIKELFIITSVSHLSMILYSKIPFKNDFIEFLLYALPQLIVFSYPEKYYYIYIFLIIIIVFLPKSNCESLENTNLIDRLRMQIMFLVSIAIYSADFWNYNSEKMGKGMNYGLKMMDIGVGCFVYNAGLLSSYSTNSKKFCSSIKCLLFGIIRYISKAYFNIYVSDAEFGVHLNFFIILAILNLLSIIFNTKYGNIIGLIFLLVHQLMLYLFLNEWILKNERKSFFMSNLEGFSYILPELGIYLISKEIGMLIKDKNYKKLVLTNLFYIILFTTSFLFEDITRRLHNLSFCLIIIVLLTTNIILYEFLDNFYFLPKLNISYFASRNLLLILILSNILIVFSNYFEIFKEKSEIKINLWTIFYLMLIYYIPLKIKEIYEQYHKKSEIK